LLTQTERPLMGSYSCRSATHGACGNRASTSVSAAESPHLFAGASASSPRARAAPRVARTVFALTVPDMTKRIFENVERRAAP
jgi:hypothetical protein